jgi:hypothetical protein
MQLFIFIFCFQHQQQQRKEICKLMGKRREKNDPSGEEKSEREKGEKSVVVCRCLSASASLLLKTF